MYFWGARTLYTLLDLRALRWVKSEINQPYPRRLSPVVHCKSVQYDVNTHSTVLDWHVAAEFSFHVVIASTANIFIFSISTWLDRTAVPLFHYRTGASAFVILQALQSTIRIPCVEQRGVARAIRSSSSASAGLRKVEYRVVRTGTVTVPSLLDTYQPYYTASRTNTF